MEMLLERCEEVKANFTSWEYAAGQITTGSCGEGDASRDNQEWKLLYRGQSRPREGRTELLS